MKGRSRGQSIETTHRMSLSFPDTCREAASLDFSEVALGQGRERTVQTSNGIIVLPTVDVNVMSNPILYHFLVAKLSDIVPGVAEFKQDFLSMLPQFWRR